MLLNVTTKTSLNFITILTKVTIFHNHVFTSINVVFFAYCIYRFNFLMKGLKGFVQDLDKEKLLSAPM